MNELKFSKRKQTGRNTIDVQEFKAITENEAALTRQCENYLTANQIAFIRIPDAVYKFIFAAGNRIPVNIRVLVAKFIKGLPDFTILLRNGSYLCVELKTKKGKQTQGQKTFAKMVKNVYIIRSFEDFVKLIEKCI